MTGRGQGSPETTRSGEISSAATKLGVLLLVGMGLVWLVRLPRALPPTRLPALQLSDSEIRSALHRDRVDSRAAASGVQLEMLHELVLEKGRSEARPTEPRQQRLKRDREIRKTLAAVQAEHGAQGLLTLRARATELYEQALARELADGEAKAVLGSFPQVLQRYGLTQNGRFVGPRFVGRVLYKARWNLICGLAPAWKLSRVEQRAYHGWLALHAKGAPLRQRLAALDAYGRAGGEQAEEARAVLLYRAGQPAEALLALRRAYEREPSLRLESYMLGVESALADGH